MFRKIKQWTFLVVILLFYTNIYSQPPLDQSIMTDAEILDWAKSAAIEIKHYNFMDLDEHFKKIGIYFIPASKSNYLHYLSNSGELDLVKSKSLLVEPQVNGTARILSQGINNDIYFWTIQIPLLVSYQSPEQALSTPVIMTMMIERCTSNTSNVCISQLEEVHEFVTEPPKIKNTVGK